MKPIWSQSLHFLLTCNILALLLWIVYIPLNYIQYFNKIKHHQIITVHNAALQTADCRTCSLDINPFRLNPPLGRLWLFFSEWMAFNSVMSTVFSTYQLLFTEQILKNWNSELNKKWTIISQMCSQEQIWLWTQTFLYPNKYKMPVSTSTWE